MNILAAFDDLDVGIRAKEHGLVVLIGELEKLSFDYNLEGCSLDGRDEVAVGIRHDACC